MRFSPNRSAGHVQIDVSRPTAVCIDVTVAYFKAADDDVRGSSRHEEPRAQPNHTVPPGKIQVR
jgi:hypothetical protein